MNRRCGCSSSKTTRPSPSSSEGAPRGGVRRRCRGGRAERAVRRRRAEPYDAAIIDVMLPRMDGLALIDALRAKGVRMPVLILSARRSVDDRVRGLQAGGDDYLTKPFAFAELLARVQALIRRATGAAEPTRLSARGPLPRSPDPQGSACGRRRSSCARESSRSSNICCAMPAGSSRRRRSSRTSGATTSIRAPTSSTCWSRACAIGSTRFRPKLLHTVRGVGSSRRRGARCYGARC